MVVKQTYDIEGSHDMEGSLNKYKRNSNLDEITSFHSEDEEESPVGRVETPIRPANPILDNIDKKEPRLRDGGWGWVVVVAAFLVTVCIDGLGFTFGLLRAEIAQNSKMNQSKTSLIGSLFIALPLLTGPIMSALVDRYGSRYMTMIAGILSTFGFLLSSMSNSVPLLCLTYGLIGGLAMGILYVTSIVSVTAWFDMRRNLALSIVSSGFGIGPLIYSIMIHYLLDNTNLTYTTIILAGTLLNLCVCGAFMRNPDWLQTRQIKEKVMTEINIAKSTTNLSLMTSSRGSELETLPEVNINIENPEKCNKDPAVLSVPIDPKKPNADSESKIPNVGENRPKISDTSEINSIIKPEETVKYNSINQMNLLNRCMEILSDNNYLKDATLHRNKMAYRGAMISIPKYRLRGTGRIDVYSNSNWSLDSVAKDSFVWYLRFWMTPDTTTNFKTFTKFRFIVFILCSLNAYAWSITPYFFLNSLMAENHVQGEVGIICTIGIASIFGMILFGWVSEQPELNKAKTHAACLVICGVSVIAYPVVVSNYGLLVVVSLLYGATFTSSYTLTPVIVTEMMPLDKFSVAYGIVLTGQGLGHLIGPPFGGMLYDSTLSWDTTFYLGGLGLIISGICAVYIAYTRDRAECPVKGG